MATVTIAPVHYTNPIISAGEIIRMAGVKDKRIVSKVESVENRKHSTTITMRMGYLPSPKSQAKGTVFTKIKHRLLEPKNKRRY